MKIEHGDSSLTLSQTPIPDVFFTEYISQANGDFVKVYIYLYFLAKYNNDVKANDLSKRLELPLKTIQDAIKYWEDEGLLLRKGQGFIVTSIQDIEINKIYKPKVNLSPEDISKVEENKKRIKAIDSINNQFFQGVMSPSWYGDIDLWFKKYGFDEEVMVSLFAHCYNKSALHRNYILAVANAWKKEGIKTFSDLDKYELKQNKVRILADSIKKKLRLQRPLTEYEYAYVEKWCVDYNYTFDIIEIALKKTVSKYSITFEYLDKLVSDWFEHGLKTVNQIDRYIETKKTMVKEQKEKEKEKTKNSNFSSRKYDDLNKFYSNIN